MTMESKSSSKSVRKSAMSTIAGVILTAIMVGSVVSGASYFFVSNSSSSFTSELSASNSKVNSQIAAVQDDSSKLKSLLGFIQDDNGKAKTQINDLSKRISDLNDDNGKLKASNDKLSSQFGAVQDDNAKLKAANDKLNPQLGALQDDNGKLKLAGDKLNSQLGALQDDNSKLKGANDKLNSQLTDVSANLKALADAAGIPINNPDELKKLVEERKLIEAAKKEGKLVFYSISDAILNNVVRRDFESKYPEVTVEFVTGGSAALADRFMSEFDKGVKSADFLNVAIGDVSRILGKGEYLAKYQPKNTEYIPPEQKDKDGKWTINTIVMFTLAYNTKIVSKDQVPKGYSDLVDPKWNGKIGLLTARASTAQNDFNKAMEKQFGEDFMRKLEKQNLQYYERGPDVVTALAKGDISIAISVPGFVEPQKLAGQPVDWVRNADNTYFYTFAPVEIAANAPHPNAARLFLDYWFSKGAAQVRADAGAIPIVPGIRLANPDLSVEGKKLNYLNLQSDAERQALIGKYPALAAEKFKADGFSATLDVAFLIIDAGKEQGIWARNGLDPEFVTPIGRTAGLPDVRAGVAAGTKIGFATPNTVILARLQGVPIKIVAGYLGEGRTLKIFVRADSSIMTLKDLDGKRVGVTAIANAAGQLVGYVAVKNDIKIESVPLVNSTNAVAALRAGNVDAIVVASVAQTYVDSGEFRILAVASDIQPKPFAGVAVYASDDLIQQNPDLVKRFVTATLETAKYLKDNPDYAVQQEMKKLGLTKQTADKAVADLTCCWSPSGLGSGSDLIVAITNALQWGKDSGSIPASTILKIEDLVDIRFLPLK